MQNRWISDRQVGSRRLAFHIRACRFVCKHELVFTGTVEYPTMEKPCYERLISPADLHYCRRSTVRAALFNQAAVAKWQRPHEPMDGEEVGPGQLPGSRGGAFPRMFPKN